MARASAKLREFFIASNLALAFSCLERILRILACKAE
jgi:hypothetical protein